MKGAFLIVVVWMLLLVSCANEPYVLMPLGVIEFTNVTTATSSFYTYKHGKMQTFKRTGQGPASMKFVYEGDLLTSIIKDSTAQGYDLIEVDGYGSQVVTDSTFRVTAQDTTLTQVRRFTHENSVLIRVDITTWSGTAGTPGIYELDWSNGNVSEVRTIEVTEAGEITEHVVTITYDNKKGVFSSDVPYEYTLAPEELYWLSANNPARFKRDTLKETRYSMSYNLKGYPSHIITDTRQLLACTYTELR